VELSDTAINYCRELLGAVIALLILCAASKGLSQPPTYPTLFCDNRGILSHGNSHLTALPERQKQADIIRLVKYLCGSNDCRATWEWVEVHAMEQKGWQGCTLPEQLNDQADKLTKCSSLCNSQWIGQGRQFPF
jgi:hypothetical protein